MSSKVIDERVLSMKFDNKQFESGVSTSMSTLDKLKAKLNMTEASKGLTTASKGFDSIAKAAKNATTGGLNGLSAGVETVQAKFSVLQVVAMTAISRITNSVITLGKKMASAVTIDPIKSGFAEYETQMNAVQTILANTKKEGTNVKIVNAALDELNHYADKTIYNFTEMTRNIGTFTAAGVKLNTSVSAIKGIANLAAVSGSTSQQASVAMYQLSQALAAGTVKLMDWNSVVNAGMGGQVFQDALIRTSQHLKTGAKAAIKAKGSFRESLQTGWLTTEVLTQTLDQFATAADTQEEYEAAVEKFVKQGYSKQEATDMANMARTAGEAATKVKTFSQLIDTLKEALGSGWTESWRTIIGDFEEARTMWTSVSDVLNDIINKSSDARNKMLKGWADLGGRTKLIESFSNIFKGLVSVITPIGKAFRDIFPRTTSQQLLNLTEGFRKFTEKLVISDQTADKLRRTFSGLFAVADLVKKAFLMVGNAIFKVFDSGLFGSVVDIILSFTAAVGDMFTSLDKGVKTSGITDSIGKMISGIADVFKDVASHMGTFTDFLSKAGQTIGDVLSGIWDSISKVFGWISDHISFGDIITGLIGGSTLSALNSVTDVFTTVSNTIDKLFGPDADHTPKSAKRFRAFLDEISGALDKFTTGVDATTMVAIAASLGIVAASVKSIASLNAKDIAKSTVAIGAMFLMLNRSFDFISESLSIFKPKGLIKMGVALIGLATAIKILASATKKLSEIDCMSLAKALAALFFEMTVLIKGMDSMNKLDTIPLRTSVAVLTMAEACKILADALSKFSGLSWEEIARGLVGMGGALTELSLVLKALQKMDVGGFKSLTGSVSLVIAAKSLKDLGDGLKGFADLSWDQIGRGLVGMGGALTELATVSGMLGKLTGLKGLIGAKSLVIAVQSLGGITEALKDIGSMSWEAIGKGLSGMGGALAELATVSGLLGKFAGLSGLVGATAIVLVAKTLSDIVGPLQTIGSMSWEAIGKGLTGIGGALTELALVSGILGSLAPLAGLLGAGTLVLAVQSLSGIVKPLQEIGLMSWEEIARGLAGMGGALTELAVISGSVGVFTNVFGLIGAATLNEAVKCLDDLADGLIKFGSMSWETIGRGLSAMNDALKTIAGGALLNTLSGLGAGAIAKIAKPLGDLADSMIKWKGVTLPKDLSKTLGGLADGVMHFTLGGLGAGALVKVAKPLGDLADSLIKWKDVKVSKNLGDDLGTVASGVEKFSFLFTAGWNLDSLAKPLGTLAESVGKWSNVTVPNDFARGLGSIAYGLEKFSFLFTAGWSLSTLTGPLGDLANTMSKWANVKVPDGIGASFFDLASGLANFIPLFTAGWSLDAITGPLGDLAVSVSKWSGVSVPENMSTQLSNLANGLSGFSFLFTAGWSLSTITGPLGDLAGSITRWSGVAIPQDLGSQLGNLADGLSNFSFLFTAGWNMDSVVGPLGDLAGAMAQWAGITIPGDIGNSLGTIANGVSKFSFLFAAGWSLSTLSGPLGDLANSVSKWSAVTVPKDIGETLGNIANGISKFSFLFVAGWSLSTLTGPLGDLVNSLQKWSSVTVPKDIESQLGSIANGIKKFTFLFVAGWSLDTLVGPLARLVTSINKLQGLNIPANIETQLGSVADSIKKFTNIGDVSAGAEATKSIASAVSKMSGVDYGTISIGLSSVSKSFSDFVISTRSLNGVGASIVNNLVNPVKNAAKELSGVGKTITNSIAKGITSNKGSIATAMSGVISGLRKAVTTKTSDFKKLGSDFSGQLATGIKSGSGKAKSAAGTMASDSAKKTRDYYSTFYNAGDYLAQGFAKGIKKSAYASKVAAEAMAKAAAKAAKKALDEHSPSKVTFKIGRYFVEGFRNAISYFSPKSTRAASYMADDAKSALMNAFSKMSALSDSDLNIQPVVTPVLDLSNISSGASAINSLLGGTQAIGTRSSLNAINSAMKTYRSNQNEDVVNAIDKLRKELNNVGSGDTYSINGVYANDEDIVDAIKSIVRAVKVERRV